MPEITTGDGVRLRYTEEGAGSPIVLIAGFRTPASSWTFQREALLARGLRVLTLDRRNHGRSDRVRWGSRIARHGRDLAEFCDRLALTERGDLVLVGASMGSSVVWAYADLFGTAGLRAVVAVDQTPKMCNEGDWQLGFYGYHPGNLGTYFADGGPSGTGHGTPPEQLGARRDRIRIALRDCADDPALPSPEDLALLRDHAVQDWRDVIARVEVPMLFVAGQDSELWPAEHAAAAAASNPLAEAAVLADCGHLAYCEQPARFNAILTAFLDRL